MKTPNPSGLRPDTTWQDASLFGGVYQKKPHGRPEFRLEASARKARNLREAHCRAAKGSPSRASPKARYLSAAADALASAILEG